MQLIDRTKVLLLTGPSGSGKSTAVRLLSRELGIEYFEFDGNEETTCTTSSDLSEEKNFSSLKEFTRFLENTQHHTLKQNASKHRLVLFDQLPISFYR